VVHVTQHHVGAQMAAHTRSIAVVDVVQHRGAVALRHVQGLRAWEKTHRCVPIEPRGIPLTRGSDSLACKCANDGAQLDRH
jgi:hypothetical protein